MPKALVIGYGDDRLWHEVRVRSNFTGQLAALDVTGWTCDIAQVGGTTAGEGDVVANPATVEAAYQYAIDEGYAITIESYAGCWLRKASLDAALAAGVWPVVAHASNADASYWPSPPRLFSAVTVAVGRAGGVNTSSYGPGLEVMTAAQDGSDYQSFATPTLAAYLAAYHSAGYGFWDARAAVRSEAGGGASAAWAITTGFGFYAHPSSLPAAASLPVQGPVDVQQALGGDGTATLSWTPFAQTRRSQDVVLRRYDDARPDAVLYEGTAGEYTFAPGAAGTYTLVILAEDASGNRSREEDYSTITVDLTADPDLVAAPDLQAVVLAADYATRRLAWTAPSYAATATVERAPLGSRSFTMLATVDVEAGAAAAYDDDTAGEAAGYVYRVTHQSAAGGGGDAALAFSAGRPATRFVAPPMIAV